MKMYIVCAKQESHLEVRVAYLRKIKIYMKRASQNYFTKYNPLTLKFYFSFQWQWFRLNLENKGFTGSSFILHSYVAVTLTTSLGESYLTHSLGTV